MIIVDGSWTFDTDLMIQYAEKDERTSYERDMLNQFRKYSCGVTAKIRDCVNQESANDLNLMMLERLQEEEI